MARLEVPPNTRRTRWAIDFYTTAIDAGLPFDDNRRLECPASWRCYQHPLIWALRGQNRIAMGGDRSALRKRDGHLRASLQDSLSRRIKVGVKCKGTLWRTPDHRLIAAGGIGYTPAAQKLLAEAMRGVDVG